MNCRLSQNHDHECEIFKKGKKYFKSKRVLIWPALGWERAQKCMHWAAQDKRKNRNACLQTTRTHMWQSSWQEASLTPPPPHNLQQPQHTTARTTERRETVNPLQKTPLLTSRSLLLGYKPWEINRTEDTPPTPGVPAPSFISVSQDQLSCQTTIPNPNPWCPGVCSSHIPVSKYSLVLIKLQADYARPLISPSLCLPKLQSILSTKQACGKAEKHNEVESTVPLFSPAKLPVFIGGGNTPLTSRC